MKSIRCEPGEMVQIAHDRFGVTVFGPIRFTTYNDGKKVTVRAKQDVSWAITAHPPTTPKRKKKGAKK